MSRCRVSRIYRLSLPLMLCVVLPVVTISGCSKAGSARMPVIKPPVVKMPSPNAYDYFVAVGKDLKDAGKMKSAVLPGNQSKTYSDSDIAAFVRKNQPALDKLREGLKYDYLQPFKYGIDARYPEYLNYMNLSYLLILESRVKRANGDWAGAVDSCQDGLLLSELIAHGDNNTVSRLVGVKCQKITCRHIWDAIPHLTGAQAKVAIARMQKIQNRHFPLHESLKCEKEAQLLFLQDCFNGKCKDSDIKEWAKVSEPVKIKVFDKYTGYMDQCIKNVQMPYATKPVFPEVEEPKGPLAMANGDKFAALMLLMIYPDERIFYFYDTDNQTRNNILATAFALQVYHADHGNYPAKLSELCPAYLKSVPDDMFALKAPLNYRRDGDKYTLWSVGPDCVNNNGTPVLDPKEQNASRHFIHRDSKGDIVAGINY
ncbi:MAG: hypothetical protein ABFD64_14095 [Armatimonadota bacterium]